MVHNPDQDRARPLDHLIKPVANSLSLRLNVYETPSGAVVKLDLGTTKLKHTLVSFFSSLHTIPLVVYLLCALSEIHFSSSRCSADTEGQVILMLQQARESSSAAVQRDVLLRAAGAMQALITNSKRNEGAQCTSYIYYKPLCCCYVTITTHS